LAEHSIKKVDVLEYEDLGMEAVWGIEVEDFPAFIVINHEGKDFYAELAAQRPPSLVQLDEGH
jgi:fumarate hydratase class I